MDTDPRWEDQPDGERARLSKSAVIDRALKLADADGLDTLTIRKLAQDLGVTPMALYWHFRSKEDLLEGMTERIWGEIDLTVDPSVPWWAQFQRGMESLISVLRAHPSAPQLLLEHEKQNQAALHATEIALEILRGAGFSPEYATAITRDALWTGISLVMAEADVSLIRLSPEKRPDQQRRVLLQLATLPPARYPNLVDCASAMTECDPEFHYRVGIELFIEGVKALAERQRPTPRPGAPRNSGYA
jgi:TetR/AcrR family tetracycline transcriptional repressor